MHLRRRRLAAKATHLSRLVRHSDRACNTEARNDIEEKDTISPNGSMPRQTTVPLADSIDSCLRHILTEFLKPIPIMIAVSVVTALVDPLEAVFLPPPDSFQPSFRPVVPNEQLPLAFVLDAADFVGTASDPIGLICLGSALACLRLHSGETFPHGATTALALARMVVVPLLGIGFTRWFVHAGFVDRDDKVLQLLCMCMSFPLIDALFVYALVLRALAGYHSSGLFSTFGVSFRHVLICFDRGS